MQNSRFQLIVLSSVVVALSAAQAMAQPSTAVCDDAGGPTICVRFDNVSGAPVEDTDFTFDFTDANNPGVDLTNGTDGETLLEWRVWSAGAFGVPANMGNLTAGGADDYDVKLLNPSGGAGALNVKKIDLDPSAATEFSNLSACHITGDLTGVLFVQETALGAGGVVDGLDIDGDVTGPLTVGTFKGVNSIGGNVTNTITIDVIDGGSLTINGSISNHLTVTEKVDEALLRIDGAVPSTVDVTIADMVGQLNSPATLRFGGSFAGDLILTNGIDDAHAVVGLTGNFSGTIDLTTDDIAGQLNLVNGNGDVLNGGSILSGAIFYPSQILGSNSYDGTATFTSVAAGAEIESKQGADIGGTIHVTGDMGGEVAIASGTLKFGGLIDIDGDMSGEVHIGLDCVGGIDIGGDSIGDIEIDGDLTGSVTVGGGLLNALTGGGQILVAGESSGPIKVGEKTGTLTLIQVVGGLVGSGATIEINTTEGFFDAEGDILIGVDPPAALPFDGCIRIYDKILGSANGHLKGTIDVIGCHDDEEVLNICVDGNDGGNITLTQTDCTYQTATHSCGTCP